MLLSSRQRDFRGQDIERVCCTQKPPTRVTLERANIRVRVHVFLPLAKKYNYITGQTVNVRRYISFRSVYPTRRPKYNNDDTRTV